MDEEEEEGEEEEEEEEEEVVMCGQEWIHCADYAQECYELQWDRRVLMKLGTSIDTFKQSLGKRFVKNAVSRHILASTVQSPP
jgi:hypothetical protein